MSRQEQDVPPRVSSSRARLPREILPARPPATTVSEAKRTRRTSKKVLKRTTKASLTQLFASRLRELRTLQRLTLEAVVELGGGGSPGRLSRLERGAVSPTLRTVEELARALEVDPIDLLIDPQIDPRHRLVAASTDAGPADMSAAVAILDPEQRHAPTARTVRHRIGALPPWAQTAAHQAIGAFVVDRNLGLADALLELTGPELSAAGAVIDALERLVRLADRDPAERVTVARAIASQK